MRKLSVIGSDKRSNPNNAVSTVLDAAIKLLETNVLTSVFFVDQIVPLTLPLPSTH
ncbi:MULTISPECIES: hypothetical protein [Pirellulaceae]|uniref:hypothetical protein n=1 Tax=Pirellulaceae TaxID=2691357 RepID=UPI001304C409|nr:MULTISPECIES: hypothetical protein [Pirellulaceae]